jgi:hypothetical protein
MLLGEIESDCERLPQGKPVVFDSGKPSVRVDRQKFRLARAGRADLGRNVLVS